MEFQLLVILGRRWRNPFVERYDRKFFASFVCTAALRFYNTQILETELFSNTTTALKRGLEDPDWEQHGVVVPSESMENGSNENQE